ILGGKDRLVTELLKYAKIIAKISKKQTNIEILLVFISWLDISCQDSQVQAYLNILFKKFKRSKSIDLTENFRVKEVVKGLKLIKAQDWEALWPQDLFSITVLKLYYNNLPD
ncbi:32081_t:CDS:2, partial [Racocetra persica]